ncbi:hypothetical protein ABZ079_21325 [Streptomyces sp. NPDC006314]|uniref:hypothetical protein n=1 Tax=Streptomyces sp. NPDC006314 TaxID=3154475 RepID=UPI0033AC5A8D
MTGIPDTRTGRPEDDTAPMPRPAHPDDLAPKRGPAAPDDDRGCLRLVMAAPLTLLTLVAGFFCRAALTIRPSGPWDDDAYAAMVLACVLTVAAGGAATGLWLFPSVRRVLGWGWAAPALTLAAVAAVRWAWLG